jgi:hypothetical protein
MQDPALTRRPIRTRLVAPVRNAVVLFASFFLVAVG